MGKTQTFFIALADRTRRRILNLMRNRELCVYDLVDALNISQPNISRHLAFLRNAEIVSTRRDGKWIFYKINDLGDVHRKHLLQTTLDWIQSDHQMQNDYNELARLFSQSNTPTIIDESENVLLQTDTYKNRSQDIETFLL